MKKRKSLQKIKLCVFAVGLGLSLVLLTLYWLQAASPSAAAYTNDHTAPGNQTRLSETAPAQPNYNTARYVSTSGVDSGDCSNANTPCRSPQYAVNQAQDNDAVLIATGDYSDVLGQASPPEYNGADVISQVVYLDKSLVIQGGYTPNFDGPPDAQANPTVLDAHGEGRGVCAIGQITVSIEGLQITNGDAAGLGGGEMNRHSGGGLYVLNATIAANDNRLYENDAYFGGGIYVNNGVVNISGSDVSSNTANTGGGLQAWLSQITFSNNHVSGNLASRGGGLYLEESSAAVHGNLIQGNTANGAGGGGLYLAYMDIVLGENTIIANRGSNPTTSEGGGVFLSHSQNALFTNNVIADNHINSITSRAKGNGLRINDATLTMLHSTIARNTGADGSGVHITNASLVTCTNTILVSHTIGINVAEGSDIALQATLWGAGVWANETDWAGDGGIITGSVNLWDHPAFVDHTLSDYHINADSAAVDAGVDANVAIDIDNEPRPINPEYDLGADEYSPDCYARLNDDVTYISVQAAVDASSNPADVIKVAGYCIGVQAREGITQMVYLSKTLTIQGGYTAEDFDSPPDPANNATTLNAQGQGRVLYVSGDIAPAIRGLRLVHGDAAGLGGGPSGQDAGGGVYVVSATATLKDNWLLENKAQYGGGVFLQHSPAMLLNMVIADNQANQAGSGAYMWGSSPRLLHTTIARNSGGDGVGLYVDGSYSIVALTNTILSQHTTGLVVAANNTVTLQATLWGAGDWANANDWSGAGDIATGTINLWAAPAFSCVGIFCDTPYHITRHSGAYDAGVDAGVSDDVDGQPRPLGQGYDIGADESRTCWVRLNENVQGYFNIQTAVDASQPGDWIKVAGYCNDLCVRPRDDVSATGVVTQVAYLDQAITLQGGYTTTNWKLPNPISYPTRIDPQGNGRGVYIVGAVNPHINGLQIAHGDASGLGGSPEDMDAGGGVYVWADTFSLRNCQVFSNTAKVGGGIYAKANGATLADNEVNSNTAEFGGGLAFWSSVATLSDSSIRANNAISNGGGLALNASNIALSDNMIMDNVCGGAGGGLWLDLGDVTFNDNTISNNQAQNGAGLALNQGKANFVDNRISGNVASQSGGGLSLNANDAMMMNDLIVDNQADNAGGGLYVWGSSPCLLHTTIVGNGATGLWLDSDSGSHHTVALTNTILATHTIGISVAAGHTATLEASLWANETDWSGAGNVLTGTLARNYWGAPAFVNSSVGDYHLTENSAAIDQAIGSNVLLDMDGETRPGDGNDIGADEYPLSLDLGKWASPNPVQAGAHLTYTLRVTNTGILSLNATIQDNLPDHVSSTQTLLWTPVNLLSGQVWQEQVVVTVEMGYAGPLTNVIVATTEQGPWGAFAQTTEAQVTPALAINKKAHAESIEAGQQLTYTLWVTNTGNVALQATINDLLPDQVTPAGPLVWTPTIAADGGVWSQTVVVSVQMGYAGVLSNVLQITTLEGASGVYTETTQVTSTQGYFIYLPTVLKNAP